jgi:hypothetical protein
MKRAAVLFIVGLTTLLLSGPVPHHVEGSVVSVNKSANTVVIKDAKGKQFNLVAGNDTVAELSRLKAGDQVEVTYKKSKDQTVATKIILTGLAKTPRTK